MELKVWVEGVQRIVCGVTEKTTCQDVVYALAHATGRTGRFTLIERWGNNERLLAPQEHPQKVLLKWGDYAPEVQFILQRSALDPNSKPAAVWKPPPSTSSSGPPTSSSASRLTPDSGRGASGGSSDVSNNSDSVVSKTLRGTNSGSTSQVHQRSGLLKNASQDGHQHPLTHPPPYREPPPPPSSSSSSSRHSSKTPTPTVRPPRYSPPPTHRVAHLSRHPSKSSLASVSNVAPLKNNGNKVNNPDVAELMNLVSAQRSTLFSQQADIRQCEAEAKYLERCFQVGQSGLDGGRSDGDLQRLKRQRANQCSVSSMTMVAPNMSSMSGDSRRLDLVLNEVRRLEEVSMRNQDELDSLLFAASTSSVPTTTTTTTSTMTSTTTAMNGGLEKERVIQKEISQLKQRLTSTDHELHRTNLTLKRLDEEMRVMSKEKRRMREHELRLETERLQGEIRAAQKTAEDGANLSHQLSKEVKEVENEIKERKSEVEKLIKEMREANLESLAISPPEESKPFLEGNPKSGGLSRKMVGSPRALETAVPTAKNPHGVWV